MPHTADNTYIENKMTHDLKDEVHELMPIEKYLHDSGLWNGLLVIFDEV